MKEPAGDVTSGAQPVADYINKNDHVTMDLGAVTLDETTTMTADGPMEYDLYELTGLKWANKDIELETASGLVPFIYSGRNPVHSLQWAIGLELALMVENPWQVALTTDSPNAGPFIRYPRVISWLMSNKRRMEMMDNKEVHGWAAKISISHTRPGVRLLRHCYHHQSSPIKIYGFEDRGNLSVDLWQT